MLLNFHNINIYFSINPINLDLNIIYKKNNILPSKEAFTAYNKAMDFKS